MCVTYQTLFCLLESELIIEIVLNLNIISALFQITLTVARITCVECISLKVARGMIYILPLSLTFLQNYAVVCVKRLSYMHKRDYIKSTFFIFKGIEIYPSNSSQIITIIFMPIKGTNKYVSLLQVFKHILDLLLIKVRTADIKLIILYFTD